MTMVKICMTSQGVFCYTCWILGVCTCSYFCNLVHIFCPQSHHQSLLPTSRFNLKLALSEEPPRVSSLAIHYAHRCITKVHQKTFMKRMLTHCERTTPHTPISTSALLWVLCGILTWFKLIRKSLFFPPFAHLNHNVAIFKFAKHTYLNKGKTIEPSDMFLNRWTLYTTYNLLVHREHQFVLHLKDILWLLYEMMEWVMHLFPTVTILWNIYFPARKIMYKIEAEKITRQVAVNYCFSEGLRMCQSV